MITNSIGTVPRLGNFSNIHYLTCSLGCRSINNIPQLAEIYICYDPYFNIIDCDTQIEAALTQDAVEKCSGTTPMRFPSFYAKLGALTYTPSLYRFTVQLLPFFSDILGGYDGIHSGLLCNADCLFGDAHLFVQKYQLE